MTIHCDNCGAFYELPKARTDHFRLTILFFAQCPACGSLRDERSKLAPYPRCIHKDSTEGAYCNVPIKVNIMCHAHYVAHWRVERKSRTDVQSVS